MVQHEYTPTGYIRRNSPISDDALKAAVEADENQRHGLNRVADFDVVWFLSEKRFYCAPYALGRTLGLIYAQFIGSLLGKDAQVVDGF